MTRRMDIEARLTDLTNQPRWLSDPWPLAREAAEGLADRSSELLDVMLTGSETLRDSAYRCLIFQRLPESVVARLTSVITCSNDQEQVAWSLQMLAWNDHTAAILREWVERALSLGGEARRAAISVIPCVDDKEESLESWMLATFDQGDETDCICSICTSDYWPEDFARTLLERGCRNGQPSVVGQALSAIGHEDLDRDWTVAMIQRALARWPEQETVLLSCINCIGERRLPEFVEFIERQLCHQSKRIAFEAGFTLGFIAPERVQQILEENPAGMHKSAQEALESWVHEIQTGEV